MQKQQMEMQMEQDRIKREREEAERIEREKREAEQRAQEEKNKRKGINNGTGIQNEVVWEWGPAKKHGKAWIDGLPEEVKGKMNHWRT